MQWKRCPICARKINLEDGRCTREGCPFRQKEILFDEQNDQKTMIQEEVENQQ